MTSRRLTMPRPYLLSIALEIGVTAAILLPSGNAQATQPLETFLDAARRTSFDVREQSATVEQRSWETESAFGRLLPAASARGVYTRNQYPVTFPAGRFGPNAVTITPQDQFDLFLQVDVPLVDLASYQRYGQARHLANASSAQLEFSQNDVQRAVARAYYAFIGGTALVKAAERSQKIAEDNLAFVITRHENGVATELDRERARATVEQSKQNLADTELLSIQAARNLETVSGIAPTEVVEFPVDDLHAEQPLAVWLGYRDTPADRVQAELSKAATKGKKAAAYALLPTLSANGQERISNAAALNGQSSYYTLQGLLSWRFDYSAYSTAQAQASALDAQQVRAERTRRNVEDDVFNAWERVRTGIVKSAAARVQAEAAVRAETLSLARYQAGALTQLDVTQAQRDAFQSLASRIQADADLQYARVLLRLTAGKPPRVEPSTIPPVQAKDLGVTAPLAPAASPTVPAAPTPSTPPSPAPTPAPR